MITKEHLEELREYKGLIDMNGRSGKEMLDTIEALLSENEELSRSLFNAKAYRLKLERVKEVARKALSDLPSGCDCSICNFHKKKISAALSALEETK